MIRCNAAHGRRGAPCARLKGHPGAHAARMTVMELRAVLRIARQGVKL